MKVSQKTDYALRAMLDLALHARPDSPARSADVAARTRVPDKFLEAILVDLRKADLVRSRRGPEGGHWLARPASRISVAEVRQAIDGPLALSRERRGRGVQDPVDVSLRELWSEVESAIARVLERTTLDELGRRVQAHRGVLDYTI